MLRASSAVVQDVVMGIAVWFVGLYRRVDSQCCARLDRVYIGVRPKETDASLNPQTLMPIAPEVCGLG